MKFKEEALEELGKNFETDELEFIIQFKKTGDLETIIQFKKTYQAAFKNLIDGMSKQLNVSEDKTDKKVNDEKVENVEEDKDEVIEGDQISEKSKTADVKYERKICRMCASFIDLANASMECQEKAMTKGGTFVLLITLKFARSTNCMKTQKRYVKTKIVTKGM